MFAAVPNNSFSFEPMICGSPSRFQISIYQIMQIYTYANSEKQFHHFSISSIHFHFSTSGVKLIARSLADFNNFWKKSKNCFWLRWIPPPLDSIGRISWSLRWFVPKFLPNMLNSRKIPMILQLNSWNWQLEIEDLVNWKWNQNQNQNLNHLKLKLVELKAVMICMKLV